MVSVGSDLIRRGTTGPDGAPRRPDAIRTGSDGRKESRDKRSARKSALRDELNTAGMLTEQQVFGGLPVES